MCAMKYFALRRFAHEFARSLRSRHVGGRDEEREGERACLDLSTLRARGDLLNIKVFKVLIVNTSYKELDETSNDALQSSQQGSHTPRGISSG